MEATIKRIADILIPATLLVILLPAFIIIVLAIKLDSRGPVFFRQERAGLDGRIFTVWKFRTMVVGAVEMVGDYSVVANDPRITRVGRFLRHWTLDELPQLINVLKGDMSIVGPRPTVPSQVVRYTPHQRRRLEVKPGMAGWAWVHGRNMLSWPERIELDIWYVDNWSLRLDIHILLRAFVLLLRHQGIYRPDDITIGRNRLI